MKIPHRWTNYTKSSKIRGTRFVACKVPLKMERSISLPLSERFTPSDLRQTYPDLKLVIDLTFTYAYYNGQSEFEENGVSYFKIPCRGHFLPSEHLYHKFKSRVDEFLKENPDDGVVCVHCTHGVNRTGYFICRYMVESLGYDPILALQELEYLNTLWQIKSLLPSEQEVIHKLLTAITLSFLLE